MKKILTGLSFFVPVFVIAANPNFSYLNSLVSSIGNLIGMLIPIVFALALLVFFWGLAKFIFVAGDPEAKEGGKNIMIWGIIALFIMVSIWGIVALLQKTLGVGGENNPIDNEPEIRGVEDVFPDPDTA